MIPWLTNSSRVRRCWSFNCSTARQQREGREGNPSVRETEETFSNASRRLLRVPRLYQAAEWKDLPPTRSPAPCNCRSGLRQSGFRILLRVTGRGSCAGSWQGDKNPQSQACFSILSRAPTSFQTLNIKKQTKRNTC